MKMDPFIEAEEAGGHSVKNCCDFFEVSRAAYYERRRAVPSQREVDDAELSEKISAIFTESNGTYGSPRVHKELVNRGVECGRRRVRRLMRRAGLEGRCKKRWRKTTVPDPAAEAAKDLIQRHFGPCEELDRRYVGDITYIATWEGWAYLATVIDLASRRVVGWALADHMRTELVNDALEMAFVQRRPPKGAIFHSDRGCSIHESGLWRAGPGQRRGALDRPGRGMLGQRRRGELLRHHQARADRHTFLADPGGTSPFCLRVHRGLVQHAATTQLARLPQSRRLRSTHQPQRRPSGGMINTANLSVEPDQAQSSDSVLQALSSTGTQFYRDSVLQGLSSTGTQFYRDSVLQGLSPSGAQSFRGSSSAYEGAGIEPRMRSYLSSSARHHEAWTSSGSAPHSTHRPVDSLEDRFRLRASSKRRWRPFFTRTPCHTRSAPWRSAPAGQTVRATSTARPL